MEVTDKRKPIREDTNWMKATEEEGKEKPSTEKTEEGKEPGMIWTAKSREITIAQEQAVKKLE